MNLLFPDLDFAYYLGFTKDQMESSLLFTFGAYISLLIIVILLVVGVKALSRIEKFKEKAKEIIEKQKKAQFWNGILKS